MPLESIHLINEESSWATWKISEEIGHFFLNLNLQDEEMHSLDLISNHYKKLEWLATRITTKSLIEHLGIDYAGMTKDEHGKPHLNNDTGYISVTHSFPYVAAQLHLDKPVGVDLEKFSDKILKIEHKYLNEQEIFDSNHELIKLMVYWSAKEALYKIHGRRKISFKEQLEINPFELQHSGILEGKIINDRTIEIIELFFKVADDYVMVYTL